jgi:membrane protease YdiL (CAAX protease family)
MTSERKSAYILGGFAAVEGLWVMVNLSLNGWKFIRYLGFVRGRAGEWPGWVAAILVVALFVAYSCRLPSVRANLLQPSFLKALALCVAVAAGILEEVMFRKWVMDGVLSRGGGALYQVLASAFTFGAVHAIWGLMGKSLRAATGAMIATGALGGLLGIVYLLSNRSLAPCIAAHFLINSLIEPGLVLAATRGEMKALRSNRTHLSA